MATNMSHFIAMQWKIVWDVATGDQKAYRFGMFLDVCRSMWGASIGIVCVVGMYVWVYVTVRYCDLTIYRTATATHILRQNTYSICRYTVYGVPSKMVAESKLAEFIESPQVIYYSILLLKYKPRTYF